MNAVDTNILLYIHDPRDPTKQATAASLVQSLTDGVLLWQVACEYLSASHKLEPLGYSRSQAWQDIRDLHRVWTTILPGCSVSDRTIIVQLQPLLLGCDDHCRLFGREYNSALLRRL